MVYISFSDLHLAFSTIKKLQHGYITRIHLPKKMPNIKTDKNQSTLTLAKNIIGVPFNLRVRVVLGIIRELILNEVGFTSWETHQLSCRVYCSNQSEFQPYTRLLGSKSGFIQRGLF